MCDCPEPHEPSMQTGPGTRVAKTPRSVHMATDHPEKLHGGFPRSAGERQRGQSCRGLGRQADVWALKPNRRVRVSAHIRGVEAHPTPDEEAEGQRAGDCPPRETAQRRSGPGPGPQPRLTPQLHLMPGDDRGPAALPPTCAGFVERSSCLGGRQVRKRGRVVTASHTRDPKPNPRPALPRDRERGGDVSPRLCRPSGTAMDMWAQTHTPPHTGTHRYAHTPSHSHMHTYTQRHAHTPSHSHMRAHTGTQTCSHTLTHAHTHGHTDMLTRLHTVTHTHTHAHRPVPFLPGPLGCALRVEHLQAPGTAPGLLQGQGAHMLIPVGIWEADLQQIACQPPASHESQ